MGNVVNKTVHIGARIHRAMKWTLEYGYLLQQKDIISNYSVETWII